MPLSSGKRAARASVPPKESLPLLLLALVVLITWISPFLTLHSCQYSHLVARFLFILLVPIFFSLLFPSIHPPKTPRLLFTLAQLPNISP